MGELKYFTAEEIAEKSWMIRNNFGDATPAICYLVEGKNYALLIDSIIGIGNLKKFCETLTEKPIKLVNTHSHSDHVGGNFHFEECYMHHRDIGFFQTVMGLPKEQVFEITRNMAPEDFREKMVLDDNFADWKPMKTYPIYDGDEFDLGDRIIEVVEVCGHTEGSIVLIDHKTRICYAGDACNGNTLLDLDGCPLSAMLYFTNKDIPVMAMMNDGSCVLIIGFNDLNTVLMNPLTGQVYKYGMNDSDKLFSENGNHFVTYIRNGR